LNKTVDNCDILTLCFLQQRLEEITAFPLDQLACSYFA